jgi:LacI family transcriptional regulator, gluconate utilization system Gnt-I transcriptional repressor
VVEIWAVPKKPLGHVVGFSNREAGATMVRYLHSRGRCRIGFIGSGGDRNRDTRGWERRLGYQQALRKLSLPTGRVVAVGEPHASMSRSGEALALMLRQWPDTDAIVCVSDLSAFGVLAECQRRGIEVPRCMAVVGFGDFEVARYCHPRLTTVAVDCGDIGRRAAEIALKALEARKAGETLTSATTIVAFRVVERETA